MIKALIINPFGIGDVLFTTPVIRAIKISQPDSFIGYWCNERVTAILEHNPHIDGLFALSRGDLKRIFRESKPKGISGFFRLLSRIRAGHFDISLDFSLDHRYSLISKLLGIKKRIGFDYKGRGRFLTERVTVDGYSGRHVIEYYADLLRLIGISVNEPRMELFVSAADEKATDVLLADRGVNNNQLIVGIVPGAGASWGKDAALKHWPADRFARLADRLVIELGATVLLLGSDSERKIAENIREAARVNLADLTGAMSLGVFSALIKRLQLLITNDGGPLHMAVALGIRTVSIFGPVDERVYGPFPASGLHRVVKSDVSCRPCYKHFRLPDCTHNRICLDAITVEEVYSEVKKLL